MLGVTAVKKVLGNAIRVALVVRNAYADDEHISWTEAVGIGTTSITNVPGIISNFKEAIDEFEDGLTPEEKAEVIAHFDSEFDLPNDDKEQWIQDLFTLLLELYEDGRKVYDLFARVEKK